MREVFQRASLRHFCNENAIRLVARIRIKQKEEERRGFAHHDSAEYRSGYRPNEQKVTWDMSIPLASLCAT